RRLFEKEGGNRGPHGRRSSFFKRGVLPGLKIKTWATRFIRRRGWSAGGERGHHRDRGWGGRSREQQAAAVESDQAEADGGSVHVPGRGDSPDGGIDSAYGGAVGRVRLGGGDASADGTGGGSAGATGATHGGVGRADAAA